MKITNSIIILFLASAKNLVYSNEIDDINHLLGGVVRLDLDPSEIETSSQEKSSPTEIIHNLVDEGHSYWKGSNTQSILRCGVGEVMTGSCTKKVSMNGQHWNMGAWTEVACSINGQLFDVAIQCSRAPSNTISWRDQGSTQTSPNICRKGGIATCGHNSFLTGYQFTKSGCEGKEGSFLGPTTYSDHGAILECNTPASDTYVEMDEHDTVNVCSTVQELATCPPGYVATDICNKLVDFSPHNCGNEICSNSGIASNNVYSALRCVKIAAYDFRGVKSNQANDAESSYRIQDCKKHYDNPKDEDSPFLMENTITHTSSVRSSTEHQNTEGGKLTESLSTTKTIGLEAGIPKGGLKKTFESSTTGSWGVETTFETQVTSIEEVFSQVVRTQKVSRELTLSAGYSWVVISFGAVINAAGDYLVDYNEYRPGQSEPTIVTEDVMLTTGDLNDETWLLQLSSEKLPAEYIRVESCSNIALAYLTQTGPFPVASLSPPRLEGHTLTVANFDGMRRKNLRGRA